MFYLKKGVRIICNSEKKQVLVFDYKDLQIKSIEWHIFLLIDFMINNNVSIHKLEEMGRRGNYVEEVKRIFNSFFSEKPTDYLWENAIEYIDYDFMKCVQIEVTSNCNFKCKHCYLESSAVEKMSYEKICEIIDAAHNLGVLKLCITGGEPLLRTDIKDIVEYASKKFILLELFTNGYFLDKEFCDFIKGKVSCVRLSIDGYDEDTHDTFRGVRGSFRHNIELIEMLKQRGIEVEVNCVLHKNIIKNVERLIHFFENDLRVKYKLDYLINMGNANNNFESIGIDIGEYSEIISKFLSKKIKGKRVCINDKGIGRFCDVGNGYVYIASDGCVKLCPSISDIFSYGNVNFEKLDEIWKKNFDIFSNVRCNKVCDCKYGEKCLGGCRSRALLINNNIYAEDSVMCELMMKLDKRGSMFR